MILEKKADLKAAFQEAINEYLKDNEADSSYAFSELSTVITHLQCSVIDTFHKEEDKPTIAKECAKVHAEILVSAFGVKPSIITKV